MNHKIFEYDPSLRPFEADFDLRMQRYRLKKKELTPKGGKLKDFANGSQYFGFHKTPEGWFYREWAPGADELYLTGEFCNWDRKAYPAKKLDNGAFELFIPGADTLKDGMHVMAVVVRNGVEMDRIPLYAKRVIQIPGTIDWTAVIYDPEVPYAWQDAGFKPEKNLFIYECHIGMAQEEGKIGSYEEFRVHVLPRIKDLGYNAIQIMAIMEHPYYASFGYQVTNFFAASSRFGRPEELKKLIDEAHSMGIAVLLDVVHSHASKNTREGINEFDGTVYQFFHQGEQGDHSAWGTKCFNYGHNGVLHFLLSNLKFWMEEYHFDGFRFDGVTSMLYKDHGLGVSFDSPAKYFSMNTDVEAITYLQLASDLVKQVNPKAILIAEDMSAMPGMCLPIKDGGIGFDYRLAMGVPDMWIRLLKEKTDQQWDLNDIYYELVVRRSHEKVIGYCESHDQALVGDKTIMFRLCDANMYTDMDRTCHNPIVDRGTALHKLLRLLTMSLGGEGYLTFMGNEFGHPEWIDFPREGNGWSYHYCRRQWSLADNGFLKYGLLRNFEKAMVKTAKALKMQGGTEKQLWLDNNSKLLVYQKGKGVLAFNLHPESSYEGCWIRVPEEGKYKVELSSDDFDFGGFGRIHHNTYQAQPIEGGYAIQVYLPSRTAIVLKKV